jgi:hypothetical protein
MVAAAGVSGVKVVGRSGEITSPLADTTFSSERMCSALTRRILFVFGLYCGAFANLVGRGSRTTRECLRSGRSYLTRSFVKPKDAPSRGPARHVCWRNPVLWPLNQPPQPIDSLVKRAAILEPRPSKFLISRRPLAMVIPS